MRITGKKGFISTIIAAIAIFIAVNIANNLFLGGLRFDLTENDLYTLSEGTRNIISSLDDPVSIKVFYSRDEMNGIPYLKSYASRVVGLLRQYEKIGRGKIELEFINPEPFTEKEDNAVKAGMQPVPIDTAGGKLYFGMVASDNSDNTREIPFFNPDREPFLEYDITRMIYDLSHPEKPVLGLLSTVPEKPSNMPSFLGGNNEQWVIFSQLEKQFVVEKLPKETEKIPDNIDLLLIVHPHDIPGDTLYAIDQFVLSGGHALVFTDPYLEVSQISSKSSDLPSLFDKWGIIFHSSEVVADQENALRVNYRDQGSGIRAVTKLNWLMLQNEYLDSGDIVTRGLGQLRVASSGHFTKKEDAMKLEWEPLVRTSSSSVSIDPSLTHSPFSVLDNYISSDKSKKQEFILAGRVTGMAQTAFPERKDEDHVSSSEEPINVIVFGDVDMLRDMFWVRKQNFLNRSFLVQTADNGAFVTNALENLSGSNDLISLRSRSLVERPFEVVKKLRLEAEKEYLQEERRLQSKLDEMEKKLNQLQNSESENGTVLITEEQQEEIDKFKDEMVKTRKQLRDVKHNLQKDIEQLGAIIKFLNIGLLPVIVIILAFIIPKYLGVRRS